MFGVLACGLDRRGCLRNLEGFLGFDWNYWERISIFSEHGRILVVVIVVIAVVVMVVWLLWLMQLLLLLAAAVVAVALGALVAVAAAAIAAADATRRQVVWFWQG